MNVIVKLNIYTIIQTKTVEPLAAKCFLCLSHANFGFISSSRLVLIDLFTCLTKGLKFLQMPYITFKEQRVQ